VYQDELCDEIGGMDDAELPQPELITSQQPEMVTTQPEFVIPSTPSTSCGKSTSRK